MKRWSAVLALALAGMMLFTACGKKDKEEEEVTVEEPAQAMQPAMVVQDSPAAPVQQEAAAPAVESDTPPDGMVANQLSGEWIDASLENQRPVAVMVDNEKGVKHYGLTQADVIYEMMNSTQNDGVTRFMALVKDWGALQQFGSIRSTRPTNLRIFPEWNAVLCHDGGPFWNDNFYKNKYVERFSGTFSRVNNGMSREFTEYILSPENQASIATEKGKTIEQNFEATGYSKTYNDYYRGDHWVFATRSNPNTLDQYSSAISCTKLSLPFHHNNPWMEYDSASGEYKYFQYGSAEKDLGNGEQVSFKNVLLERARMEQLDDHGYMMYYPCDSENKERLGWYITNGKAVKVTWSKMDDLTPTKFYDEDGVEIKINVGTTYIGLIRNEEWDNVSIE